MNILNNTDIKKIIDMSLQSALSYDYIAYALFHTLYLTGCRYAELVHPENWSVIDDNNLSLQPAKKNNIRLFKASEIDDLFLTCLQNNYNIFAIKSYTYYLRTLNRLGGISDVYVKNKGISLHIFRHYKARILKEQGKTDLQIQQYLGERSLNSAKHYIYSTIYRI